MSDRNGTVSSTTPGTKVADVPVSASAMSAPAAKAGTGAVVPPSTKAAAEAPEPEGAPVAEPAAEAAGVHPTAPVTVRPAPRAPRSGPLTRMGPWAPVAGALFGVLSGLVVVLLLLGTADGFRERLALVFVVVGLSMLGASGTLLADEVRIVRRGAREAAVRPAWVEATAGLLNGLTPARLLLLVSGFVLFLATYVARG